MKIHTCFHCKAVYPTPLPRCPQCGTDSAALPPSPSPSEKRLYLPAVPQSTGGRRSWKTIEEMRESQPAGSMARLIVDTGLKKMGLL